MKTIGSRAEVWHGNARMTKLNGSFSAVFNANAFGLQHVSAKSIRIVQAGRLKAMENRLKFVFKNNDS